MTDTSFYDTMAALATELMSSFGTPATLRRITKPKPNAEGKVVPSVTDVPGLAVRIKDQEALAQMELMGDVGYAIKFPSTPAKQDQLIHANQTYEILSAKLINPEGTRLMLAIVGVKRA